MNVWLATMENDDSLNPAESTVISVHLSREGAMAACQSDYEGWMGGAADLLLWHGDNATPDSALTYSVVETEVQP